MVVHNDNDGVYDCGVRGDNDEFDDLYDDYDNM